MAKLKDMPRVEFDPNIVAKRAIPVLRERAGALGGVVLGGSEVDAGLILRNDGMAGSALVSIRERPNIARHGRAARDIAKRHVRLPIGHFDASTQHWVIYPDYIEPEERDSARDQIEELAEKKLARLRQAALHGGRFIDLRHELTQEARSEVEDMLESDGFARRLLCDPDHDFEGGKGRRRVDDSTGITYHVSRQATWLSYVGLVVEYDPCSNYSCVPPRVRSDYDLVLQVQGFGGNAISIKGSDLESYRPTQAHVDFYKRSDLTGLLLDYANAHPDFSAAACAIAYNEDNAAMPRF